jgi:hypothetical protein
MRVGARRSWWLRLAAGQGNAASPLTGGMRKKRQLRP